MGSGGSGHEDVEWLEGEEPAPGRVRQLLRRRLATRGGKAAVALLATAAVTVAVTTAVVAWPDERSPAVADGNERPLMPSAERPTPPRDRDGHEPVVQWKVVRVFDDSVPTAPGSGW